MQTQPVEILRQSGIASPVRVMGVIRETIAALDLDLSGLTILTEAASGAYVVTPVIAAAAAAERVIALTRESHFADVEAVSRQTSALAALCDVDGRVEVYGERSPALFADADIVTNLGFVRPIDAKAVAAMKPTAVVPLMCEAWELRPGDIDLVACRRKGIRVVGTNEDFPGLAVFTYCGYLCLRMLFEAQVEVYKSRILIVSGDKFGREIERRLAGMCARVCLAPRLRAADLEGRPDVLVVADYLRCDAVIGPAGDMTAEALARLAPGLTVVQFAGRMDVAGLQASGLTVFPEGGIGPHRMSRTLASLGPRPVVELHAAGLKVGQMYVQRRYDDPMRALAQELA
jgi:hypothetical protein